MKCFGGVAMAVLASQGRRLGLSNASDAHSKHIVLVKLTDSSLEALTNYINHVSSNKVRVVFVTFFQ